MMELFKTRTGALRWGAALAVLGLILLTPAAVFGNHSADHARAPRSGTAIDDQYIIMLEPGSSGDAVRRAYDVANPKAFTHGFNGFSGRIPPGRLRALENDPRVEAVIPDRVMKGEPGPPGRTKKGGSSTSAEMVPSGVARIGAAPTANLGVTGAGVGIAVIDSGVDLGHIDLRTSSTCFDAFGGDCSDDSGHGTHVSGVAAALANGIGVVGAAPSATIYAVKVLDAEQGGGDSHLLAGIEWVLANARAVTPPIRVANLSLGRRGDIEDNLALRRSIQALIDSGIVVITSAGNDPDISAANQILASYPEVITVASSTSIGGQSSCASRSSGIAADTLSYFSSYAQPNGDSGVDIAAPGEKQENVSAACVVNGLGILSLFPGDSLAEMSGTSMSAPLVSGTAALLLEREPSLTPAEVATAIKEGASATALRTSILGHGDPSVGILSAPGALNSLP
jgi:subtilisin